MQLIPSVLCGQCKGSRHRASGPGHEIAAPKVCGASPYLCVFLVSFVSLVVIFTRQRHFPLPALLHKQKPRRKAGFRHYYYGAFFFFLCFFYCFELFFSSAVGFVIVFVAGGVPSLKREFLKPCSPAGRVAECPAQEGPCH